jgi:VanZ family protein
VAGELLPSQRRDRPGLAPGSLTALRVWRRAYHSAVSSQTASAQRSPFSAWLPVVVWAGVIFAFSSVPSLSTHLGTWDTILRKLAHASEYAILAALLHRALRTPSVWLVVLLAGLYAVTDEVHQRFVEGRHGAPLDVGIDALGALAGVLVWRRWLRRDCLR